MPAAMSGSAFAEFVESRFESAREFFSRSSAPVMEEDEIPITSI